jgi:hypothetical protein
VQYHTREASRAVAFAGRGLELAWLDDPVDVYFLQVQGSGRIRMTDGNGGARGLCRARTAMPIGPSGRKWSGAEPTAWTRFRRPRSRPTSGPIPGAGTALLYTNPSYVFFRKIATLEPEDGPIGAMGRSITTMRSIAIDPKFTPLGAPVWIEKDGRGPIRSLMVAQDTGGAIKGMQRADIFYGTGTGAGDAAGTVKDGGRMVFFCPSTAPSPCWTKTDRCARRRRLSPEEEDLWHTVARTARALHPSQPRPPEADPPRNHRRWHHAKPRLPPFPWAKRHAAPERRDLAPGPSEILGMSPCRWTPRPTAR